MLHRRNSLQDDKNNQSKTVVAARQQRHFLCRDKENEAKESLGYEL
jgi:hypothetical protein